MKRSPLQLAALILALTVARPVHAVVLTALYDNAGAPTAFGKKVLEAFQGKDLKGKDGPMHRIGMDLIVVSQEFEDYQAGGGRKTLGRPFKPANPLIRTDEESVIIDAVATDDTEALRRDLVALGLQNLRYSAARCQVISPSARSGTPPRWARCAWRVRRMP
jgi:hypothetical protein